MAGYLHQHPEFRELLRILESETDIQTALIEKDYWIMHVLYGLKSQEYDFELKGGTSLSKGYKINNVRKSRICACNPPRDKPFSDVFTRLPN
jgi:hypothetical protein